MDIDIKQWYAYLLDVCGTAKATILLAEKILQDYNDKSNMREMQIVLINALYHSAAINVYRIFDTDEDALGIRQFRNKYYGLKAKKPKFKFNDQAEERLRIRRNNVLAHSDKSTLSADIVMKFPLYIEDLNSLLKSVEDELLPLANEITGACFGKDIKTGEWFFKTTNDVKQEYDIFKSMLLQYRQMETYMKENCPTALLNIYYDGGKKDNGQP